MLRQRTLQIHAQLAARRYAAVAEACFGFLDVGQDTHAALIVSLAVQRGADVARGPLQQAHTQPRLQLLDGVGGGGGGHLQILRRLAETFQLDDAGENPHGIEAVHYLCDDEPAHKLMAPSCAWASICASSSAVKDRFCSAATFSRICAALLAPISVEVMRSSRSTQASAICASVWPRRLAISFRPRTRSRLASLKCDDSNEPPPGRLTRASAGTPFKYLSLRMPCASAVKVMQPMPSWPSVSSRPSVSIQRFSIL